MRIEVEAPEKDVADALRGALTKDEMALLAVQAPKRDPFAPSAHQDLPTFQTVVEFTAAAIAGGVIHDGAKAALRKAATTLQTRFGDKAQTRDDQNAPPDDEGDGDA